MSLDIAGLVDQVAKNPEWTATTLQILNKSLSGRKVSPNYNLMVTLAGRSYVFSSDGSGMLKVMAPGPGQQTVKALGLAQARIILETGAMKDFDAKKVGWDGLLLDNRLLRLEGDVDKLDAFQGEIAPLLDTLRRAVDLEGPGQATIDRALSEWEEMYELEQEEAKSKFEGELSLAMLGDKWSPDDYANTPEFQNMWMVVYFSTMTTMFGSVGQGNYNACNGLLDSTVFFSKIQRNDGYHPVCHMWGGVGSVGMREKTFGSADVLNQGAESMLIQPEQAMGMLALTYMGVGPEWQNGTLMDPGSIAAINSQTSPPRDPDPWGRNKRGAGGRGGRGGGLTFDGEVDDVEDSTQDDKSLFPGRRVRLAGLKSAADMNGKTGSLMTEIEDGKWHVRLDDDLGDKILKIANLRTFGGKMFEEELPAARDDFSIAGTWSNWIPQDMQWDDEKLCYTADIEKKSNGADSFTFAKGKAGSKPWKVTRNQQQYTLHDKEGVYRIKLFLKESGAFKDVDVKHLGDVKAACPEGAVSRQSLNAGLRRILVESCPHWSEKDVASVQARLSKVQVNTVSQLVSVMKSGKELNEQLANISEKGFSSSSLKAIRERLSQLD